jgi:hypothetical protein
VKRKALTWTFANRCRGVFANFVRKWATIGPRETILSWSGSLDPSGVWSFGQARARGRCIRTEGHFDDAPHLVMDRTK